MIRAAAPFSLAAVLVAMALGANSARALTAPGELAISAAPGSEKPVGKIQPKTAPQLELRGSRGEVLNFTVRADRMRECVPYGVSPWSPRGETASSPVIRFFSMPTLSITHQSFPHAAQGRLFDPLIEVTGESLCPEPTQGAGQPTWLWGELEIPESAKPGEYRATLRVGKASLAVRLTVWKMKMPRVPTLPAYSDLSSWFLLLGHYGSWHAGEEILSEKYALEMQKHRIFPVKSFIAKPPFASHGDRPTLDLRNAPSPAQSFTRVTLKHRPKEIYFDFPTIPPTDIDKPDTIPYFKAIEASLPALKRPGRAMVYLWDEPEKSAIPDVIRLARIAKQNSPDLKVLVTITPKPELDPYVDIYVPVMDQFDVPGFPDAATYRKLQRSGKEVWWYVSCMSHGCDALADSGRPDMVIERPAAWIRSIGWLSKRFGIDAFLYYAMVNGYSQSPKRDPWDSLWDFSGNGDGTLFYPGRPGERGFTEHVPVPSIRLKTWRESSFDAEYIRWMQELPEKPDWWERGFSSLVRSTKDWEHDYSRYQELRDRVGSYLNSR